MVKEFYANLGERRNLTCYVNRRWVPFGERVISQLFGLRERGCCTEYEQLQKNPNFEEIAKELTDGKREWSRTKTISNAFLNRECDAPETTYFISVSILFILLEYFLHIYHFSRFFSNPVFKFHSTRRLEIRKIF